MTPDGKTENSQKGQPVSLTREQIEHVRDFGWCYDERGELPEYGLDMKLVLNLWNTGDTLRRMLCDLALQAHLGKTTHPHLPEQTEREAARYRWLRDEFFNPNSEAEYSLVGPMPARSGDLDAAIDAALESEVGRSSHPD